MAELIADLSSDLEPASCVQLRRRTDIDVASGVSMAMAPVYTAGASSRRWAECPGAGWIVPEGDLRRKGNARPGCLAAVARGHHGNKSAIHLIMFFLCALSCIRAVVNA